MPPSQFGIYLHKKEGKVVRINSPYWIPPKEEWVYLAPEVNITLLQIRELVKKRRLFPDPDQVQWGSLR